MLDSMHSMGINRRQWLGLAFAAALAPRRTVWAATQSGIASRGRLYLAARKFAGHYEATLVTEQGQVVRTVRLAGRGHSFALDSRSGRVVAFARQPGTQAVMFSCAPGKLNESPQMLHAAAGRTFSGHGAFSENGQLLYAAENDYEAGRGVIGLYRLNGASGQFEHAGEWKSEGVGPHEIILDVKNSRLCVANGGLLRHPDYDKLVLNRGTMQASLTYLDSSSGHLLSQHMVPVNQHKQSIRHLVLDHQQHVWFGCQYQGSRAHQVPLVGVHTGSGALGWVSAPEDVWHAMQHYVGSIAFDPITRVVAASSPLGGVVAYWNAENKEFIAMHDLPDGCGVAPASQGGFVATSGFGRWVHWHPGLATPKTIQADRSVAWDHHLRML